MTVALTPAEAESKISQIESARDQAVAKLNQIQDTQQTMLSNAWQGGSASKYSSTSSQQHDDFTQLISDLNTLVQTGSAHMRSIANMDNG
jgi:uncharacterized protein YukE